MKLDPDISVYMHITMLSMVVYYSNLFGEYSAFRSQNKRLGWFTNLMIVVKLKENRMKSISMLKSKTIFAFTYWKRLLGSTKTP